MRSFTGMLLRIATVSALTLGALAGPAEAKMLRVGITLHPYYSFVANIVGDRAKIIPLIDSDANPHGDAPQSADMIRMMSMDVMVVNGIGHDSIRQDLGLQVSAVIEPRHGVEPTARQLAETIDRIKAANVNVLFAEKYFASKLSDTIRDATGVRMYSISHISSGPYTKEKFIEEMRENLTTIATAIRESAKS